MLQQLRTVVGAMTGTLVVLGVVAWFAVGAEDAATAPPMWLVVAQLVVGVVVFAMCETVGYRTPAIAPGASPEEARRTSQQALTSSTFVRAALCESIALVSLAVAFVIPHGGVLGYAVGAAVSIALLLVHAWPGQRVIERIATSLERDGGRSGLREAAGLMPRGPIQEL